MTHIMYNTLRPTYESKNVVITGASRGIGRSLAREFLSQGHRVVISSKTSYGTLRTYKELCREYGNASCMYHVANVQNEHECANLATAARNMLKAHIDIWINNAGTTSDKRTEFSSMNTEDFRNIIQTNLLGTMFACFYALHVMNSSNSAIVNFEGSGVNTPSVSGYSVYSTSKIAIRYFTDSLRSELYNDKKNIFIHTVSPGMVMTDMLCHGNNEQVLNALAPFATSPEECAKFIYKELIKPAKTHKNIVYLTPYRFLIKLLKYPFHKQKTLH